MFSEAVSKWFSEYCKAFEGGDRWEIVWVSDDEIFVVVHSPGTYWSDCSGRYYGKSRHFLVNRSISTPWGYGDEVFGIEGKRWSKRMMTEFSAKVKEIQKAKP